MLCSVVMTTVGIHLLFKRIDRFNDVTLSKRCKKEMEENPTSFVFVYPDIEDFETTAKHMSFTSLAEAHALHLRSRLSETGRERMFHVSQTKFEEAIAANPDSTETILLYANVLKEQALKHSFKIDWKMLESVVLKYSEANNASEIYSLVESLKEENAYKPYYIEFRCQGEGDCERLLILNSYECYLYYSRRNRRYYNKSLSRKIGFDWNLWIYSICN